MCFDEGRRREEERKNKKKKKPRDLIIRMNILLGCQEGDGYSA